MILIHYIILHLNTLIAYEAHMERGWGRGKLQQLMVKLSLTFERQDRNNSLVYKLKIIISNELIRTKTTCQIRFCLEIEFL